MAGAFAEDVKLALEGVDSPAWTSRGDKYLSNDRLNRFDVLRRALVIDQAHPANLKLPGLQPEWLAPTRAGKPCARLDHAAGKSCRHHIRRLPANRWRASSMPCKKRIG